MKLLMRWRPDGVVMKQFAIHIVLLAKGDLATRRPMQSHQAVNHVAGASYQVAVSPVFLEPCSGKRNILPPGMGLIASRGNR